jgi:hypothetical protein
MIQFITRFTIRKDKLIVLIVDKGYITYSFYKPFKTPVNIANSEEMTFKRVHSILIAEKFNGNINN